MNPFTWGWRSVWLWVLLAVFAHAPHADEPDRRLIAAFLHFPPMAYVDDNGEPAGSVIDLTNRIAAESGMQITWVIYPIRRIYRGLETGEIDIWPGSQAIPALQEFTLETPSIGVDITLCAFSLEGTPRVENLETLSRNQLVLIRGYTYRAQLDALFQKSERKPIIAPDHSAAIQLLKKGRGDYLISYGDSINLALSGYPQVNSKCDVLDTWPLVYVVSRHTPDAQHVTDQLARTYRRLAEADSQAVPFARAR